MHRTFDLAVDDLAVRKARQPMGAAVVRGVKLAVKIVDRKRPLGPLDLHHRPGRKIGRLAEEKHVGVRQGQNSVLHMQ